MTNETKILDKAVGSLQQQAASPGSQTRFCQCHPTQVLPVLPPIFSASTNTGRRKLSWRHWECTKGEVAVHQGLVPVMKQILLLTVSLCDRPVPGVELTDVPSLSCRLGFPGYHSCWTWENEKEVQQSPLLSEILFLLQSNEMKCGKGLWK